METLNKWKPIEQRQYYHEVIWPNDVHYNRLKQIQKDYPVLTFQNDGYEKLDPKIREENKEILDEIRAICRDTVAGFSEFNNFKLRKNGDIVLRMQYSWSRMFTGVGYFDINYWNEAFNKECVDGTND